MGVGDWAVYVHMVGMGYLSWLQILKGNREKRIENTERQQRDTGME